MSRLSYTLLASNSDFAYRVLHTLCTAQTPPSAIALIEWSSTAWPVRVLHATANSLSVLAFRYRIPLLTLPVHQPDSWPTRLRPSDESCLLSACFPARIPDNLYRDTACFNLHPSQLPAFRGPTPLFWQFHNGEHRTGISLHCVNSEFDSGDIVSAKDFELPRGIRLVQIESRLAVAGARLFMGLLQAWRPGQTLNCRPQGSSRVRYDAFPNHDAYLITSSWTVDRAIRFIQGVASHNRSFCYDDGKNRYVFRTIQEYPPDNNPCTVQPGNVLSAPAYPIQLADGKAILLDAQPLAPAITNGHYGVP